MSRRKTAIFRKNNVGDGIDDKARKEFGEQKYWAQMMDKEHMFATLQDCEKDNEAETEWEATFVSNEVHHTAYRNKNFIIPQPGDHCEKFIEKACVMAVEEEANVDAVC